ncbi:MAG: hypothetical protein ACR2RV_07000 [Verrucomicrobiales bacterium]
MSEISDSEERSVANGSTGSAKENEASGSQPIAGDESGEPAPPLEGRGDQADHAFSLTKILGMDSDPGRKHTSKEKAQLLYEYSIASERKVSETVHNLYIIAEHYSGENPDEIANPATLNGIPPFFPSLTPREKADYCYDQVTEALSLEVLPVTVESLCATQRDNPNDPWSSNAGRFVRRIAIYVALVLVILLILAATGILENKEARWVAFGCLGALVHLRNHALTTTRLQTFELSEERKIWPRLLLGGMFGFVVPWLLGEAGLPMDTIKISGGAIAAFFGGYSTRFAINLLDRLLEAVSPTRSPK